MSLKENLNLKIVNITTQHKSKTHHLEKNSYKQKSNIENTIQDLRENLKIMFLWKKLIGLL